jgi:hypothetical protein
MVFTGDQTAGFGDVVQQCRRLNQILVNEDMVGGIETACQKHRHPANLFAVLDNLGLHTGSPKKAVTLFTRRDIHNRSQLFKWH